MDDLCSYYRLPHYMVNIHRLLILALIACPSVVIASDNELVNATVVYGLDTNPHKLSSGLTPVDQNFAAGEFRFRSNLYKTLYFNANANKSVYFDDARGDKFDAYANIALKSDFKIFKRKFKYKIAANYRTKDKTYVSKTTGLVATFGGQSIADRYDSDQINYLGELSYKPHKFLKLDISYQSRDKTYQEFEIPGLSNLDYTQQYTQLGMQYKASDVGRFYLNVAIKQREYLDKRAKDLDGADITDTDLIYDYHTVNIGYIYRPSKDIRWKYAYNYEDRTDNGTGYYNANSGYLSIAGKYRLGDYHFLKSRMKYSRFSFVNQLDRGEDPLDEEAKEKQGASLMIGYEWIVATLFDSNFAVYLELEHSNFDNTNVIYAYERSMASIGIRWSAF